MNKFLMSESLKMRYEFVQDKISQLAEKVQNLNKQVLTWEESGKLCDAIEERERWVRLLFNLR